MNLNVDSWKEFRLGDLFSEMYKAEAHVKGEPNATMSLLTTQFVLFPEQK